MSKVERPLRFGPEIWVTVRETGEHVKIECWSGLTSEYRVRSSQGLFYHKDEELDEVIAHPEAHLGRRWTRCQATKCGAPLTPELPICTRCQAPTCRCGRCQCTRGRTSAARTKTTRKKTASSAG